MIGGHPRFFAPPELYLLSYETLADRSRWFEGGYRSQLEGIVRAMMQALGETADDCVQRMVKLERDNVSTQTLYRLLQSWIGDQILVDKTPAYSVDIRVLQKAERDFHQPRFIHLNRHPYGMIRSFEEAKLAQLWWPRLIGPNVPDGHRECPFGSRQLGELIWTLIHENIRTFLSGVELERQMVMRYEDLVSQPEQEMVRICDFLGVPFDPNMLNPLGNSNRRMTDGIRTSSRMIGDPKFHRHRAIDPSAADQWKRQYDRDFLAEDTWALARSLGYSETVAGRRIEFEI